jgi:hypothetical protein
MTALSLLLPSPIFQEKLKLMKPKEVLPSLSPRAGGIKIYELITHLNAKFYLLSRRLLAATAFVGRFGIIFVRQ